MAIYTMSTATMWTGMYWKSMPLTPTGAPSIIQRVGIVKPMCTDWVVDMRRFRMETMSIIW